MATIDKNAAPTEAEVEGFLKQVDFNLPKGFIDFFKETNGADVSTDEKYVVLWALTQMIQLNRGYSVEEYAPDFFIFGSDGGDTAFAIEKKQAIFTKCHLLGCPGKKLFLRVKLLRNL